MLKQYDDPTIPLTLHARQRMQQRSISITNIEQALRIGIEMEQNGATIYFIGHRQIPVGISPAEASRLVGVTVIVARDGSIITAFRCNRVPKRLRRRTKHYL